MARQHDSNNNYRSYYDTHRTKANRPLACNPNLQESKEKPQQKLHAKAPRAKLQLIPWCSVSHQDIHPFASQPPLAVLSPKQVERKQQVNDVTQRGKHIQVDSLRSAKTIICQTLRALPRWFAKSLVCWYVACFTLHVPTFPRPQSMSCNATQRARRLMPPCLKATRTCVWTSVRALSIRP